VKALAKRFRWLFLKLARRALPGVAFPYIPRQERWVVFAKPVVYGNDKVLEYFGRYVHRTALSERALLALDDRTVTFRYRDSRDHQRKTMTLAGQEFLRRFLQHVPAKGFHRVRAFGLLHPEYRPTLRRGRRARDCCLSAPRCESAIRARCVPPSVASKTASSSLSSPRLRARTTPAQLPDTPALGRNDLPRQPHLNEKPIRTGQAIAGFVQLAF
jgi:hypothetical protein